MEIMNSTTSLNFYNLKMQLKARLRVPTLIKSKRLNIEFDKNYKSSPTNTINLASYTQSKTNKSNKDSFYKYSLKTNLLKRLLSNMSIKELYHEEEECSKRCKEVINEIDSENRRLVFQNLPLIRPKIKFIKKKIIIKRIKSKPKPIKRLIYKKNLLSDYQNIPYLSSSSNKVTSYIESTKEREKEKEKEKTLSTSKSKIELSPITLFNYKQNYSIIKGGGIRYDNSIFRYKNMNDLLHF
jgi:hypothetical protein